MRKVASTTLLLAVLVAGGFATWWFVLRTPGAEEVALEVFRALESGDAERVERAGVEVPDAAAAAFGEALALIAEPSVRSASETEDRAEVVVAFRLDGDSFASTVALRKVEGRWVPDAADVLGTVVPHVEPGAGAAIGFTVLPNDEPSTLLPAVYLATAAPSAILAGEQRIEVFPGGPAGSIVLDAEVRPDAAAIAQAHLDDYLDACTQPAASVPANCGIRVPWGADLASLEGIRFRIDRLPVLELTEQGFIARGGELVATATGRSHSGRAATSTYRSTDWGVQGDILFEPEGIVLRVW